MVLYCFSCNKHVSSDKAVYLLTKDADYYATGHVSLAEHEEPACPDCMNTLSDECFSCSECGEVHPNEKRWNYEDRHVCISCLNSLPNNMINPMRSIIDGIVKITIGGSNE